MYRRRAKTQLKRFFAYVERKRRQVNGRDNKDEVRESEMNASRCAYVTTRA